MGEQSAVSGDQTGQQDQRAGVATQLALWALLLAVAGMLLLAVAGGVQSTIQIATGGLEVRVGYAGPISATSSVPESSSGLSSPAESFIYPRPDRSEVTVAPGQGAQPTEARFTVAYDQFPLVWAVAATIRVATVAGFIAGGLLLVLLLSRLISGDWFHPKNAQGMRWIGWILVAGFVLEATAGTFLRYQAEMIATPLQLDVVDLPLAWLFLAAAAFVVAEVFSRGKAPVRAESLT